MILAAYAVPHPPIILPEVGRGEEEKISRTREAFRRMAEEIAGLKPDTLVLVSPHAPLYADGFYLAGGERAQGDLLSFNIRSVEERVDLDRELTFRVQEDFLEAGIYSSPLTMHRARLDHGSLIPLRFIHESYRNFKVLLMGLSGLSQEDHRRAGRILARAGEELGRRMVFIASGDLSHVLKADGPYGYQPQGPIFDREIERIFSEGDLEALFQFDPRLVEGAAECGLRSFQLMAGFLDGVDIEAQLYSYEGPFGVGYAVASFFPLKGGQG